MVRRPTRVCFADNRLAVVAASMEARTNRRNARGLLIAAGLTCGADLTCEVSISSGFEAFVSISSV